tara:strand:- start:765 stop:1526 length:762 start_codon:yes stop_codon:yes gene_type:complete
MSSIRINERREVCAEDLEILYAEKGNFGFFVNLFFDNLSSGQLWTSPSHKCIDADIFQLLSVFLENEKVNKFFIEAGANNGLRQSNSFIFEQCFGWPGLLVEPILYNYQKCFKYRGTRSSCVHGCISSYDGEITGTFDDRLRTVRVENDNGLGAGCTSAHKENYPDLIKRVKCFTYSTLCDKYSVPKNYGFLSLDVEGHEREIISPDCFSKHRPALLCIETTDESVMQDIIKQDYELVAHQCHDYFFGDKTVL